MAHPSGSSRIGTILAACLGGEPGADRLRRVGVAAREPKAPTMVLDTVTTIQNFVDVFIGVYILVIILWVLASWIRIPYLLKPVEASCTKSATRISVSGGGSFPRSGRLTCRRSSGRSR